MAADGMTNREIAQALFLTEKTIEVHLTNTLPQARHRLALAAAARARGKPRGDPRGRLTPRPGSLRAMKITRLLPIPIVALALAAAGASAHDNGKTFSSPARSSPRPTQIDLGTPGPSAGDQQIITMDVFKGAKRVGESHVVCTHGARRHRPVRQRHRPSTGGQIAATGLVTADAGGAVPVHAGDHRRHRRLPQRPRPADRLRGRPAARHADLPDLVAVTSSGQVAK